MKKFFTTMLVAFAAIAAYATDFNESIIVTVNGVSSEQNGVISLVQNGTREIWQCHHSEDKGEHHHL